MNNVNIVVFTINLSNICMNVQRGIQLKAKHTFQVQLAIRKHSNGDVSLENRNGRIHVPRTQVS